MLRDGGQVKAVHVSGNHGKGMHDAGGVVIPQDALHGIPGSALRLADQAVESGDCFGFLV